MPVATVFVTSLVSVPTAEEAVTLHVEPPMSPGGVKVVVGPVADDRTPQVALHPTVAFGITWPCWSFTTAANVRGPPSFPDAVTVSANGPACRTSIVRA